MASISNSTSTASDPITATASDPIAATASDPIPSQPATDPSPSGAFSFTTFGAVKINDNSRVRIPADRAADFARAATYFSAHTNRHTLTVTMGTEANAKLLAKQLSQWATDHNLSTSPKRDGNSVTWRFAKPAAASKNGPVTVTQAAEIAEASKAGAEQAVDATLIAAKNAMDATEAANSPKPTPPKSAK